MSEISDFFDEDFYLEQIKVNPPSDPFKHYCELGWRMGLDPSPDFSTRYYLELHADVRESGISPLEHFVLYGQKEGRQTIPSRKADPSVLHLTEGGTINGSAARIILKAYQPYADTAVNLSDYFAAGWRKRLRPQVAHIGKGGQPKSEQRNVLDEKDKRVITEVCEEYLRNDDLTSDLRAIADSGWYEQQCETLGILNPASISMDVVTHYLTIGRHFRLSINPIFDMAYYLDRLEDWGSNPVAPENALLHYLLHGEAEGLRPCALFDPNYYAARYCTVERNAFAQFIETGAERGYQPSAIFWSSWYCRTYNVTVANPLAHFYTVGLDSGLLPNPLIDLDWYRELTGQTSNEEALRHYVSVGFLADLPPHPLIDPSHVIQQSDRFPGRREQGETAVEFYMRGARDIDPSPLFDTSYYLSRLDRSEAIEQPLAHYIDGNSSGFKCPNAYFIDKVYYEKRPDIQRAGVPALSHYVHSGHKEDIRVHPLVDHKYLMKHLSALTGRTPLEVAISGTSGDRVALRPPVWQPDTINRSKWLPIALDIDESAKSFAQVPSGTVTIGILAHVFYVDLLDEVIAFACNVPQPSVLLISTNTTPKRLAIIEALEEKGIINYDVRLFENRGRDIAPSFFGFLDWLETLEYAVHIHTKRSRHYGTSFDKWRRYLFRENGGSRDRVEAILRTFEANPTLGALAPVDFSPLRKLISWGHNRGMVESLLELVGRRMSLENVSLEFPSGSMFWFRVKALRGFISKAGLRRFHFDPEDGQIDGTLAHAIERAFFMLIETGGYDWARFCTGGKLGGYHVTTDIRFARSRLLPSLASEDPLIARFPEIRPFFSRAVENARPRLNLLIPTADQQLGYAGVSEAIRQFRAIGQRLGPEVDMRIISTDVPFNNMTILPTGFSVSDSLVDDRDMVAVPGFLRETEPLGLREKDIFVASAWWTAKQAYELLDEQTRLFGRANRRMIYLIQDFEPGFYAWSTRWALAENTYRHADQTIAIFNTPLLADFMSKRYQFSASQTFCPMINEEIVIPAEDQLSTCEREKIVLLYARPHAERNCLEMIEAIVSYCIRSNGEFWADWKFLAIGEAFEPSLMSCGRVEVLGRLSLEDYRAYLSKSRLGVSIMVSPHPSYPPLEMAANGVRVLTNTYEGKDLSELHENLESFTVFDPAALARRLQAMAESPSTSGKPLIDWFFGGGNNLDIVAKAVVAEIRKTS